MTNRNDVTVTTPRPLSVFLVRQRLEALSLSENIQCYAQQLVDLCGNDNSISFNRACSAMFPLHSRNGAAEGIQRLLDILNSRAAECGVDMRVQLYPAPEAEKDQILQFEAAGQRDSAADSCEGFEQAGEGDARVAAELLDRSRPVVVFYQNEMMLDWVNGAVIMVDLNGRVTEANNTALNLLGWPLDEFIGRQLHDTVHHSEHDGRIYSWDFCPVYAALADGSSHHVDGDHFWRRDGSSFVVDFIVCPARNENDEVIGAVIIFRNLTEERMREANRVQSLKMESLGVLSSGIAHEINTPIQFIGSNLAFLQESFQDYLDLYAKYKAFRESVAEKWPDARVLAEELEEFEEELDVDFLHEEVPSAFKQTSDGVERVSKLVLGLKGFVHSGDNQSLKAHDLNEVIQNALVVCQNAYKYVADLETDFAQLPPVDIISGDIGQVIVNLVVNAAHAIEDNPKMEGRMGRITVRTRLMGDRVKIEVTDTGGGIPESIKNQIFDPFFTTKDVGQGTGQGLAISRSIIHDKHEGELSVVSEKGRGTMFTIILPVRCRLP